MDKKILPLWYNYKTEIKPSENMRPVEVEFYQSKNITINSFYKSISKIVCIPANIHYDESKS